MCLIFLTLKTYFWAPCIQNFTNNFELLFPNLCEAILSSVQANVIHFQFPIHWT